MPTLLRLAAVSPLAVSSAYAAEGPSDVGFPPAITLALLALFAALFAVLTAARKRK